MISGAMNRVVGLAPMARFDMPYVMYLLACLPPEGRRSREGGGAENSQGELWKGQEAGKSYLHNDKPSWYMPRAGCHTCTFFNSTHTSVLAYSVQGNKGSADGPVHAVATLAACVADEK